MEIGKFFEKMKMDNPSYKELSERKDFSNLLLDMGNIIERERILNKMQQKELAKRAGTSQSHISRIENGTLPPSLKTLQKIAEAFGGYLEVKISYPEKKSKKKKAVSCKTENKKIVSNVHGRSKKKVESF